ncbi:hypothetical protein HD599_001378 [Conyzicola lurida]|uniref:DUF222 domain-containing protein n=1 Tax=Conyzicola lurida TaxID=1172621 RepID=A0A841ANE2_9MICO|nr:HNH endonuclease signature motif containing protein [Conyzicola lurida]MBB5843055.1 hypothetical protein [Conyzicola lurida]
MSNFDEFSPPGGLLFEPPPDPLTVLPSDLVDTSLLDASLSPVERRQALFGLYLDDAETEDRQLAVAAARRARRIDELRVLSEQIAAEEAEEESVRRAAFGRPRRTDSGWTVKHRAQAELATEIAAAFTLTRTMAEHLVVESKTLVTGLPLTLDALAAGAMRYEHAKVMASTAADLDAPTRAVFERELVPLAGRMIVPTFRKRAVQVKERLHQQTLDERHQKAVVSRALIFDPGENGMGYLTLHAANEDLAGIYNRITDIALPKTADDNRTLAQRRADVATEILLKGDLCGDGAGEGAGDGAPGAGGSSAEADGDPGDGTGKDGKRLGHGVVAQIHIEIPILTLLGKDTAPATLEGSIPVDPATARTLVADAPGFYRLLTDPVTGSIVSFDDRFRHLPPSLRRAVRLIDGKCTGPWCDATANESHGHHPVEWSDSHDTSLANSALACAPDHRLIHNTRWLMNRLPDGDKEWISPCGRRYVIPPQRRLAPGFLEAAKDAAKEPTGEATAADAPQNWDTPLTDGDDMPF